MFLSGDVIEYVTSIWPIVIAAGLFAYWYYRPNRFPPGPRGFPLIGTLPYWGKNPEQVLNKWADQYGQIYSVRVGQEDWIVLNNYDVIKEAFVKNFENFSGKPSLPLIREAGHGHGLLFMKYGQEWKEQRKFGSQSLYHSCKNPLDMDAKINEEAKYLIECIKETNNKPTDLSCMLVRTGVNNIFSIVAGSRYSYDDPLLVEMLDAMHQNFCQPKVSPIISLVNMAPFLRFFPPFSGAKKKYLENTIRVSDVIQAKVDEHKDNFDPEHVNDFVDCFLLAMQNHEGSSFQNDQLVQYIRDMLSGGVQNMAATILWGIICFLHYPQTQVKLFQEINQVLGTDKEASMSSKSSLPYTYAFVHEILRFRTMVYLNSPHLTTNDVTFRGFHIPNKTKIFSNLWAVHNDVTIWEEPQKFNPDRHLNENGEFVKSKYVIPFSIGPRYCIGEKLATSALFLNIIALVQSFKFLPDPNEPNLPDITGGCHGGVYVPDPFTVIAKKRISS